jgi:adenosylcobinamide-phosphate guanylyltransferase
VDAIIMCGGEGTRLDADVEKPLYEVRDEAMIDSVLAAVAGSRVDEIVAAVSPHTPQTRAHLDGRCRVVKTPGDGYVEDLQQALATVSTPTLTVAADLPLLTPTVINRVLDAQSGQGSLAVVVPTALKRRLGVSVDTDRAIAPTGCNVVGSTETDETLCSYDARLAVNVNTTDDAAVAADLVVDQRTDAEDQHDA